MFASGNTMVDVMYQPYATYFPYHHQRTSSSVHGSLDAIKKFGVTKLHDPLETSPLAFPSAVGCGSLGSSLGHGHSHGSPAGGGTGSPGSPDNHGVTAKEESGSDKEQTPHTTQYLSSNCVLVTYFSGDISSNVDEHFSRALSQGSKSNNWKEGSPSMSQRNFPPSFWNSAWQPPPTIPLSASSHQDLPGFTTDPYSHMTSSLHGMHGSLHNDPWRYPLTSQAYSHHGMHDFAGYSSAMAASSSRFNPHYSSLLPGSRFGSMAGQCDPLSKHTDSWASRYAHTDLTSNLTSHHDPPSMTSLHGGLGGKWY